jgi:hypothetical protein
MQLFTPEARSSTNAPATSLFLTTLVPGTAAAMGTVTLNPSAALLSDIRFRIDVAGAETVAVSATTWGGDTITAATLPVNDLSTGNTVFPATLATGNYAIPNDKGGSIIRQLIFTKSNTVQIGSAAVAVAYDAQGNL